MADMWTEWQKMWRAGTMLSETMTASQAVVGHRTRTIEHAMSDPMSADYGELNRMVSEKATAFGAAGTSNCNPVRGPGFQCDPAFWLGSHCGSRRGLARTESNANHAGD